MLFSYCGWRGFGRLHWETTGLVASLSFSLCATSKMFAEMVSKLCHCFSEV